MNVEELKKELKAVAIPNDAVAMKAHMKNKFEFLGVKTPATQRFFSNNRLTLLLTGILLMKLGIIHIENCST